MCTYAFWERGFSSLFTEYDNIFEVNVAVQRGKSVDNSSSLILSGRVCVDFFFHLCGCLTINYCCCFLKLVNHFLPQTSLKCSSLWLTTRLSDYHSAVFPLKYRWSPCWQACCYSCLMDYKGHLAVMYIRMRLKAKQIYPHLMLLILIHYSGQVDKLSRNGFLFTVNSIWCRESAGSLVSAQSPGGRVSWRQPADLKARGLWVRGVCKHSSLHSISLALFCLIYLIPVSDRHGLKTTIQGIRMVTNKTKLE